MKLPHSKLLLLTAAVASLSGLVACGGRGDAEAPANGASLTITTATATRQSIPVEIVASGAVAAWEEMALGVELTGIRIARVLVEVGDVVKSGQPLLELDKRTLAIDARQAEASLAQARANLELAQASANRGATLLDQKLISTSDSEELRANLSRAEAQLESAVAERDAKSLRLRFATLTSPDAGIISSRTAQPGQIVSVGTELMRLIRRGRLEWRAQIADRDIGSVKPGARVELSGPDGARVEGIVRAVAPSVDVQSRTALIYADLPKPGGLKAGMFAEGRIVLGKGDAMVVPREAVVVRDGYSYVFMVDDKSRVHQRRVTVGSQRSDVVVIRDGLAPEERVAVQGAGFLSDGDLVRVAEAARE